MSGGLLDLSADEMNHKYGHNGGHPSDAVDDLVDATPALTDRWDYRLWRPALTDLIEHVLVPLITLPVHTYRPEFANPVRVDRLGDMALFDNWDDDRAAALLEPFTVSLPLLAAVEFAVNRQALMAAGLPVRLAVTGLSAQISAAEMISMHTAGHHLDERSLRTLTALR